MPGARAGTLLRSLASSIAVVAIGCGASAPDPRPIPRAPGLPPIALQPLAEPVLLLQEVPAAPSAVALDPRGELLAVAAGETVVILRHRDRAVVARHAPFETAVASLRFSDDGETLLAVTRRGEVRLWNVTDDTLVLETGLVEPSHGADAEVTVDASGGLAVVVGGGAFLIIDLGTGAVRLRGRTGRGGVPVRVEGGHASVTTPSGLVQIWRLADGALVGERDLDGCATHRPTPGGEHLILGACADGSTRLLEVASGATVWSRSEVAGVSPRLLGLAGGAIVGLVRGDLVDLGTGRRLARDVARFALHGDGRIAIVHSDGRAVLGRLAAGSIARPIALGKVAGGARAATFRGGVLSIETSTALAVFDAESGRSMGRFDVEDADETTAWAAGDVAAWVTCAAADGFRCRALRFTRATRHGTSSWDLVEAAPLAPTLVDGTDGVLVPCSKGGKLLFEPTGVTFVDDAQPVAGGLAVGSASASPDGRVLALGTPHGLWSWTRSSGSFRAIPSPRPAAGEPPPEISWHPDGSSFVAYRAPTYPPDPEVIETAYLYPAGAAPPVELRPTHAWSSVTWHPSEPIVFLNSGYGSAYNLTYWAGAHVSSFRADGRPLGRLVGHTVEVGRRGGVLAVLRGHPSRTVEGASTEVLDAHGRRAHFQRPGHPVAWAVDDSWVVLRTSTFATINAPSGPDTYTLYDVPGGAKRGSIVVGESATIQIDEPTATCTVTDERGPSRFDLRTGAALGPAATPPAEGSRRAHRWSSAVDVESTSSGVVRLKNERAGRALDIHVRARVEGNGCTWLLTEPGGGMEGDVASFFRRRLHADLRRAPLDAPPSVAAPRLREGLYRGLVAR